MDEILALCFDDLANLDEFEGRVDSAAEASVECALIRERLWGPLNLRTMRSKFDAGKRLVASREPQQALSIFQSVLEALEVTVGDNHFDTALTLNALGNVKIELGDAVGASEAYRRALDSNISLHGRISIEAAQALVNLGASLMMLGMLSDAKSMLEEGLGLYERFYGKARLEANIVRLHFAHLFAALGDNARAGDVAAEALANFELVSPQCVDLIAHASKRLAFSLKATEREAELAKLKDKYPYVLADVN